LSLAFSNTLVSLASFNPPSIPGETYQEVLREELVAVANSDGKPEEWTRRKYQLLTGMDSFLKEGLRLYGASYATLMRMVTKKGGYTFSNGLHVPEGVNVCIPGHQVMRDDSIYPNADEFDGFRHQMPYHLLDPEKVDPTISMSSTGPEFLTFGHGVHACPGRFLATTVLKVVMRHLLEKFDVEVVGKGRADPQRLWNNPAAPMGALVRIRRRAT
jgi:cytochrome P450